MSNRIPHMSVLALAAAFALGASTPGVAAELPRHKAGIWETTMIVNGAEPMVMKLCFAPEWEKKALDATVAACAKHQVSREGAAWVVESTCTMGSQVFTGRTVTTGDFDSAVSTEMSATANDGTKTTMKTTAKWLRACGANDKPGSIVK